MPLSTKEGPAADGAMLRLSRPAMCAGGSMCCQLNIATEPATLHSAADITFGANTGGTSTFPII